MPRSPLQSWRCGQRKTFCAAKQAPFRSGGGALSFSEPPCPIAAMALPNAY